MNQTIISLDSRSSIGNFVDLGVNPTSPTVLPANWQENIPNPTGAIMVLPGQGHAAAILIAYLYASGVKFTHGEFGAQPNPTEFTWTAGEIYSYTRKAVLGRDRSGNLMEIKLNADRHSQQGFVSLEIGNPSVTGEGWFKAIADKVIAAIADCDLDKVQVTVNSAAFGPVSAAVVLSMLGATGRFPMIVRSTPTASAIDTVDLQKVKTEGEQQAKVWATKETPICVSREELQEWLDMLAPYAHEMGVSITASQIQAKLKLK